MASFDENGKYIKTNWKAGDKITATKLNKIEESIEAVNDNDISRHVEADARLDALEAKDEARDKEFTNVKNLIEDAKDAAELGDYEINSRMTFLENEFNEGIEEVRNVAETVAEVEADLEGLHAKDEELSEQLINIDVENIKDIYLYDLKLNNINPAQCIVCDDENENFYVTQPIDNDNSTTESLEIYRLSLNGCVLDSMIVEYGGHGTTFGLYKESGKTYIFADINKVNSDGTHSGYSYICKFEYVPNETIDINSAIVDKYVENVGNNYSTPFTDHKNNLIGYRKVKNGKKSIEIRYISDVISGKDNLLYSYPYTSEMSSLSLQGICMDGETNKLYISFGNNNTPFKLFEIDYTTGEILNTIEKQIGLDKNGIYEDNIGEPQGLCIFKNTRTHEKTLISLVSSGVDSKRRKKVIALSSNNGVNYLFGLKNEITQNYKLTRDNGEPKRIITGCTNLTDVKEAGFYYITTSESANLTDHPEPNVSGWWLHVYTTDVYGRGFIQKLVKNSSGEYIEYVRIIANSTSLPTPWRRLNVSEVDITLDKKVINLSNIDNLACIKQPNVYYMTTSITNGLIDHPEPGVGGWFLEVLNSTTDGKFIQRLIKNSDSYPKTYQRLVKGDVGGAWKLVMTQTIAHGPTSERPTSKYELIPGSMYFDTTLNKPIFRNKDNNGWVDASGKSV